MECEKSKKIYSYMKQVRYFNFRDRHQQHNKTAGKPSLRPPWTMVQRQSIFEKKPDEEKILTRFCCVLNIFFAVIENAKIIVANKKVLADLVESFCRAVLILMKEAILCFLQKRYFSEKILASKDLTPPPDSVRRTLSVCKIDM